MTLGFIANSTTGHLVRESWLLVIKELLWCIFSLKKGIMECIFSRYSGITSQVLRQTKISFICQMLIHVPKNLGKLGPIFFPHCTFPHLRLRVKFLFVMHCIIIIFFCYCFLQGGMKRWGFKGGPASHGASLSHRSIGSTGQRDAPGKVRMTLVLLNFHPWVISSFLEASPDFSV